MNRDWFELINRLMKGKDPDINEPVLGKMVTMYLVSDLQGTHKVGWKFRERIFLSKDQTIREVYRTEFKEESELPALKAQLGRALNEENFEEAARLRDEIKQFTDGQQEGQDPVGN